MATRHQTPLVSKEGCHNLFLWKLAATEGYKMSKPMNGKITDVLYIDETKHEISGIKVSDIVVVPLLEDDSVQVPGNPRECTSGREENAGVC